MISFLSPVQGVPQVMAIGLRASARAHSAKAGVVTYEWSLPRGNELAYIAPIPV